MQGGCTCENCSLLRIGSGNVELAAMFAPKPQAMTAANDWTKEMMTKGYPQLQQLYDMVGAKDDVYCREMLHFPHNYNYVSRMTMYHWFNRYLKLGVDEAAIDETDYEPLTAEEQSVWNAEHPAPQSGDDYERSLTKYIADESDKQIAALTPTDTAEVLVWADPADTQTFPAVIERCPMVRWIQLPYAGIEPFAAYLDDAYQWTCGKGVYAPPVGEHVVALALAGLRHLGAYARATTWTAPVGRNLFGAKVTILGGGGIAEAVVDLLAPFGCDVTVVRRRDNPVGDATVLAVSDLSGADRPRVLDAVRHADIVVLALALTDATRNVVDAEFLAAMASHAWLINVARGGHVDTDALVRALATGTIGGAALDVTNPEPLHDGHPLWTMPNVIITPHTANTPEMGLALLARRVEENVRRWRQRTPLLGLVDVASGY